MFFQLAKHMKVHGDQVKVLLWAGWSPEMASGVGHLLLPPGLRKSQLMLLQGPEKV
jgi:hypothetical protein